MILVDYLANFLMFCCLLTYSPVFKIFVVGTVTFCGYFVAETQVWTKPVISGVQPSPRDSHSCTTVGDNLFVFGGTDGKTHLKDLHVLDTCNLFPSLLMLSC